MSESWDQIVQAVTSTQGKFGGSSPNSAVVFSGTASALPNLVLKPNSVYVLDLTFPTEVPSELAQQIANGVTTVLTGFSNFTVSVFSNTIRSTVSTPAQGVSNGLLDLIQQILGILRLIWSAIVAFALSVIGVILIFSGTLGDIAQTVHNLFATGKHISGSLKNVTRPPGPGGVSVPALLIGGAAVLITFGIVREVI